MNARELAEKIYLLCFAKATSQSIETGGPLPEIESLIEAALNEAFKEGRSTEELRISAIKESHDRCAHNAENLIAEAKKQAYEEGFKDGHNCDKSKADIEKACYLDAAKIAEEEWKKHPFPQISPNENAELTALRIRDAIKAKEFK